MDRVAVARLSVDLDSGFAVATTFTDEVCLGCRELLSGSAARSHISEAQRKVLEAERALGKRGSASGLRLPDWGDALLDISEGSIANRLLNPHSVLRREDIISRVMKACGGLSGATQVSSTPVAGVPQMRIERDVLVHIINNGGEHHVRYAPLIRTILDDPTEVWSKTVDGKPDQIHYLRKFKLAYTEITVLVVGDGRGRFLRTAFRLNGRAQAQRKRDGQFVYAKWIGK